MRMQEALKKLRRFGITTTTHLDQYAKDHPYTDAQGRLCIASRYKTLVTLCGVNAATSLLHELSIKQCCKAL